MLAEVARDIADPRTGAEDLRDARLLERSDVGVRNDAAGGDQHVVHLPAADHLHDPGKERHVRPGQDRQSHDVYVLLLGGVRDHLRRLTQPGVDHLEALVTEPPSEHLCAAVVTVEPGFCDQHPDRRGAFLTGTSGHAAPILVASRSISAASAKSLAVRPPEACVERVKATRRQRMSMSGWWSAASAASATLTTSAMASRNDGQRMVLRIASPSLVHSGTRPSTKAPSSSLSSVSKGMLYSPLPVSLMNS